MKEEESIHPNLPFHDQLIEQVSQPHEVAEQMPLIAPRRFIFASTNSMHLRVLMSICICGTISDFGVSKIDAYQ